MFLMFRRYGEKWYARTPTGEIAFGSRGGLYEWRDGDRIDYSGPELPAAHRGQMTTYNSSFRGKPYIGWPKLKGLVLVSDLSRRVN